MPLIEQWLVRLNKALRDAFPAHRDRSPMVARAEPYIRARARAEGLHIVEDDLAIDWECPNTFPQEWVYRAA